MIWPHGQSPLPNAAPVRTKTTAIATAERSVTEFDGLFGHDYADETGKTRPWRGELVCVVAVEEESEEYKEFKEHR